MDKGPTIRIEGDGTSLDTRVLVDGKALDCSHVQLTIDAEKPGLVKATIVVYVDEIDLKYRMKIA